MEYSVNSLSKLAGVSARTLRYYDEIGLLKPARVAESGYRMYGRKELNTLQQILFFRELGVPLSEITTVINAGGFDRRKALESHLAELLNKRERLDALIHNVTRSIGEMKGELSMSDKEKFEGFIQNLIDENEKKYGAEARERYGDKAVDDSNERLRGISMEQYDASVRLTQAIEETLKAAFETGDPAGEQAQKACELHKQWLGVFNPHYSKEYHKGLGELYVADERFKANYDKLAPGCAEFLRDAINIFCG